MTGKQYPIKSIPFSQETKAKTISILLVYCVSGTLLTLVNKLAITLFPYVNMLVALQNGATVVFLVLGSRLFSHALGSTPLLGKDIIILWMPLTMCFITMLTSSLLALSYVSVPTVIVMRNLSTLLVALLEYVILAQKISGDSISILVGMLLSAILYAKHDFTLSVKGYAWLCANVIATSVYQVYIKTLIKVPLIEGIGAVGMSYYNNLISLPILFILACVTGEVSRFVSNFHVNFFSLKFFSIILFSCILSVILSTSAFALNKLVSATSIMVANNANKFSVIVLSEVLLQSTLDYVASFGATMVLFFGWLYAQVDKSFSRCILFVVIIMVLLSDSFECGIMYNKPFLWKEKLQGNHIYRSYLPKPNLSKSSSRLSAGIFIKNATDFPLPNNCRNRNASIWKICEAPRCVPYKNTPNWTYPRTTVKGEKTGEFINRVLEIAWGVSPPSVDLYLRAGCAGIMEMKHLFESIELFWPRFLGSVVVVLDTGDEVILKYLLPKNPAHHYVIAFEHPPCLPGRVFNQYSYLNLDRHCTADYVVTIDSDCVFHLPVTPDLIFRKGKVLLASSRLFQKDMWRSSVDAILGEGLYDGHYMISQPITFALSTFSCFRKWFHTKKGICYEDRIATIPESYYPNYCWMCQLGTYLERGHPSESDSQQYWYHDLDNSTLEPIVRFSLHLTHEPNRAIHCLEPICYEKNTNEIIIQGLCRAFGSSVFQLCANYSDFAYVDEVTFLYAHMEIQAANITARKVILRNHLTRLFNAIQIALRGSARRL